VSSIAKPKSRIGAAQAGRGRILKEQFQPLLTILMVMAMIVMGGLGVALGPPNEMPVTLLLKPIMMVPSTAVSRATKVPLG